VNGVVLSGADLSTATTGLVITNSAGIDTAIQSVATLRASNGAAQSRLGFESDLVTTNKANLEAANSRIIDVDVAEESTQLARWNTLVQAGTSMLSQANQSAQTALKLLQ
jgi:flagellin